MQKVSWNFVVPGRYTHISFPSYHILNSEDIASARYPNLGDIPKFASGPIHREENPLNSI